MRSSCFGSSLKLLKLTKYIFVWSPSTGASNKYWWREVFFANVIHVISVFGPWCQVPALRTVGVAAHAVRVGSFVVQFSVLTGNS